MNVLWVATKVPWPPVDGGRLLLWNTLRALRSNDVEVDLVAPSTDPIAAAELRDLCRLHLVPTRPSSRAWTALRSVVRRRPWTIERHDLEPVRRRMAELLAQRSFDVVQVEQVQALAQVPPAASRGEAGRPAVVLRAQNVESDLWRALADRPSTGAAASLAFRHQARLLARYEGEAVRRCDGTLALTRDDAARLRELAGRRGKVEVVPAPVETELPAGPRLDGDPALVLFGSSGWKPNEDGAVQFLHETWSVVKSRLPGARLHVFGGDELPAARDAGGVHIHPRPADSRMPFADGSILVVPLFVASGVRMKILEAWARGVPVVATPAAVRGLEATAGDELLVSDGPAATAEAIASLGEGAAADSRREEIIDRARQRLRSTYAFDVVADRLLAVWRRLETRRLETPADDRPTSR